MSYFTSQGKYRYGLLRERLQDPEFQEQLKKRFSVADYTIAHANERSLVTTKVDKYLSQLQRADRRFVLSVVQHALYVPFDELLANLKQMVARFLEDIGEKEYYILLNDRKFASMALMLVKVYPLLDSSKFLFATNRCKLPPESHLLIVDDASYTGTNLCANIDEVSFANPSLTVHVAVPYVSQRIKKYLETTSKVRFYQPQLMSSLEELVGQSFPDEVYQRFEAVGVLDFHDQIPLYFDHCVASKDSSFPTIYTPLISHPPDRGVRHRLYDAYFLNLLPPPMPL